MKTLLETMCVGLLVLFQTSSTFGAADDADDDVDNNSLIRTRRAGWNMYRLGRGLQMLRLGKRTSDASPGDLSWLSTDGAAHNPAVRQLPLPRYGKDLDWVEAETAAENLRRAALAWAYYNGLRPAPRGGRFRRDLTSGTASLPRSVARPRYGRDVYDYYDTTLDKVKDFTTTDDKTRAVPAPRIGRK